MQARQPEHGFAGNYYRGGQEPRRDDRGHEGRDGRGNHYQLQQQDRGRSHGRDERRHDGGRSYTLRRDDRDRSRGNRGDRGGGGGGGGRGSGGGGGGGGAGRTGYPPSKHPNAPLTACAARGHVGQLSNDQKNDLRDYGLCFKCRGTAGPNNGNHWSENCNGNRR
jgi:hypothetical protein